MSEWRTHPSFIHREPTRSSPMSFIKRARLVTAVAAAGVVLLAASPAQAASAPKPLNTFGDGSVVATADSAVMDVAAGQYGGVYLSSKSMSSKRLSDVDFSFINHAGVGGGAPRFSWPIDTDGKGNTVDGYAFMDVNGCGGAAGVEISVSTDNPACAVYLGTAVYANWDALAAANPTYRSAQGAIPFIIADAPGHYVIDGITLR
jgi:hypothetical protein